MWRQSHKRRTRPPPRRRGGRPGTPRSSSHAATSTVPLSRTTSTPARRARLCHATWIGRTRPPGRFSSTRYTRPSQITSRSGIPASVGASFGHNPPAALTLSCRRRSARDSSSVLTLPPPRARDTPREPRSRPPASRCQACGRSTDARRSGRSEARRAPCGRSAPHTPVRPP